MTTDADHKFLAQQRDAARVAARAQIRDVRLLRTQARLLRDPDPGRTLSYDVTFTPAVDFDQAVTDWFVVRIACQLSIEIADEDVVDNDTDDTEAENTVATADFEYAALFDCDMRDSDNPLSEDELTAYAETTARFALYPYMREYIYDTTGRLALPPLTLGVLARQLPGPPAEGKPVVKQPGTKRRRTTSPGARSRTASG